MEECNEVIRIKLKQEKQLVLKTGSGKVEDEEEKQPGPELTKTAKIEEDIRKAKLRDIARMKDELQQKLMCLSENAELLQKGIATTPKIKKDKEYYMLSKADRRGLKTEFEAKRQEALEFVKKTQVESKIRKKREKEKRKMEDEKLKREMEEKGKEAKAKEAEQVASRHEEAVKNMQLLKQKREEDLKKQQEQEEKFQPKAEYLYQKYEERYKKNVELPLLEARKQILAEKRNVLKPVTKDELEERLKKYEQIAMEKEEERKRELKRKKEQEAELAEKQKRFKTDISEKIHERDIKQKVEEEIKAGARIVLKKKMDDYAHTLKEKCPVVPSERKASELKQMIERIKHPVKESKDVRKDYLPSTLRSKRASHSADKDGKKEQQNRSLDDKNKGGSDTNRLASHNNKQKSSVDAKTLEEMRRRKEEKAKQLDYLTSIRIKREEKYKVSKPDRYNWASDIKNEKIGALEKRERVERKARMIEEQAKKKEQLYYLKGGAEKNVEMGEYVSDMFIDAIKAKLAILDNI